MKKKILHFCNDFFNSKVHENLYAELDKLGEKQVIFNPVRKGKKIKSADELGYQNSIVVHSETLQKYHRIFFHSKIRFLYESLLQQIDIKSIKISHATTLFSDGALAYKLFKEYGIPYVITVRNTDMNLFFRYMFHLRKLGIDILKSAEQIIFISPSYKERFLELSYLRKIANELNKKCLILPNGVDDFWVQNHQEKKELLSLEKINLLFVGKLNKGKNVPKLIRAVNLLNKDKKIYHLNLVGSDGKDFKKIIQLIKGKDNFKYWGEITDKVRLKTLFSENDIFTMPSHQETFGLVYIEALSQGIPVLYTKNEGIDGCYGKEIGEAVDSKSTSSIAFGIKTIAQEYSTYNFIPEKIVENHHWSTIAKKYKKLYKHISNT